MKRKNTISSSLKKKGKELNLEQMKEQVQKLHTDDKEQEEERVVRLSVDAPEGVYLALKGKVLRERTTIKKYVLGLIKESLDLE